MDKILKILLLSILSLNVFAQGFTSNNTVTGNFRIINGVIDLGDFASDPSTFANGQMYYNTTTGTFRCKEGGTATDCISEAGIYSATTGGFIPIDPSYFVVATAVTRYVNPTNGSNTICDGKGTGPSSGGIPCAWASVPRAMDDIPNGYTSNVDIRISAGTFTNTETWRVTAIPGAGSPQVRIHGDCTVPTAKFTTTGTGVANVTVAGGGKNGGVTSQVQPLYTPTIASTCGVTTDTAGALPCGSITGVTDSSHFLRATTQTAGAASAYFATLASTSPNLTIVNTATSALTSQSLCPFATVYSAVTILGSTIAPGNASTVPGMTVNGIQFTSNTFSPRNVVFNGTKFSGTGSFPNDVVLQGCVATSLMTITSKSAGTGTSIIRSAFLQGIEMFGNFGTVTGLFRPSTTSYCMILNQFGNIGSGSKMATFGGIRLGQSDFEGTCTGIYAGNSVLITDVGNPASISFDVTGQALALADHTQLRAWGSGGFSGKFNSANGNTVTTGSNVVTQTGLYGSLVNLNDSTKDWALTGHPIFSNASVLVGTPARSDTTSGSYVVKTGAFSEIAVATLSQGGTGTGTTFTLGSAVFAGTSGVYSQDNANFFWDDTNNRLGILDATPAASLTVGTGDLFQVNSLGRVLTDVGTSGAGNLALSFVGDTDTGWYHPAADQMAFQSGGATRTLFYNGGIYATPDTATANTNPFYMEQSNTQRSALTFVNLNGASATAHAALLIETASGGGDPFTYYVPVGSQVWTTGVDRSDSGKFKISTSAALETNTRLIIDPATGVLTVPALTINGGVLYTNGSGVFAQTAAGTTSQVLHGGAIPSFGAVLLDSEVFGTLPTANGGTGGTYPITLTSIPLSGSLSAATLNSLVLPARSFTVTAQRINVSVAGSTGSTNVVLRVTDGTNNCDASFACNATAGAKRPTLSGTCTFSASATLTMSVNSTGDCVTPPVILGVLDIEGNWP